MSSSMLKQQLSMSIKSILPPPCQALDGTEQAVRTDGSLEHASASAPAAMSSAMQQLLLDSLGLEDGGKSEFLVQPELKVDVVRCAGWSGDTSALPSLAGLCHNHSSLTSSLQSVCAGHAA
jgi:hypothetical protein